MHKQAEEYHFVRVLTREGLVLMQMLEKEKFIWQDAEYKNQVLTECRQMAEAWQPAFFDEFKRLNVSRLCQTAPVISPSWACR